MLSRFGIQCVVRFCVCLCANCECCVCIEQRHAIWLFCSAKTWFMVFHVNDVLRRIRQPLKYNIFVEKHFVFAVYSSHLDWLHRLSLPSSLPFSLYFSFDFTLCSHCDRILSLCFPLPATTLPPTSFPASFPLALFTSMSCCMLYMYLVSVCASLTDYKIIPLNLKIYHDFFGRVN